MTMSRIELNQFVESDEFEKYEADLFATLAMCYDDEETVVTCAYEHFAVFGLDISQLVNYFHANREAVRRFSLEIYSNRPEQSAKELLGSFPPGEEADEDDCGEIIFSCCVRGSSLAHIFIHYFLHHGDDEILARYFKKNNCRDIPAETQFYKEIYKKICDTMALPYHVKMSPVKPLEINPIPLKKEKVAIEGYFCQIDFFASLEDLKKLSQFAAEQGLYCFLRKKESLRFGNFKYVDEHIDLCQTNPWPNKYLFFCKNGWNLDRNQRGLIFPSTSEIIEMTLARDHPLKKFWVFECSLSAYLSYREPKDENGKEIRPHKAEEFQRTSVEMIEFIRTHILVVNERNLMPGAYQEYCNHQEYSRFFR